MALSQSKTIQRLIKAAELAYLRDRQQAVYVQLFVDRIERCLLAHPKYIRKFDLLLKEVNSDIRQTKWRAA
jgi:hypothetical protein